MILLTFTITVNPDQRAEVLTEFEKMVKASHQEADCLSYSFYADAWEPKGSQVNV